MQQTFDHSDSESWRPIGPEVQIFEAGSRVDQYLAQKYPFLTRNGWKEKLEQREISLNLKIHPKQTYRIQPGDRLYIFRPPEQEPEVDTGVHVIWQEGGAMACFKPGNLPMHESGPFRTKTFAAVLAQLCGKEWSAVHRIDRETSGIVLCGATPDLRQKLAMDFMGRKIDKRYLALVHNNPKDDEWLVDQPIGEPVKSQIRIKKWVSPTGLPSETLFRTLSRVETHGKHYALLEAIPRTGRTNQIRVHASWCGHHLVGDKLYHPSEKVFLAYFEENDLTYAHAQTGHKRCALHAAGLRFRHPDTGKMIDVESPMPEDMEKLWFQYLYG